MAVWVSFERAGFASERFEGDGAHCFDWDCAASGDFAEVHTARLTGKVKTHEQKVPAVDVRFFSSSFCSPSLVLGSTKRCDQFGLAPSMRKTKNEKKKHAAIWMASSKHRTPAAQQP